LSPPLRLRVDADYTGRFTTNIVVRNIGHGVARNITFAFSAPLESTSGYDITELPYFRNGINFMAPQTSSPPCGTPTRTW
jgi:hypothetical protein